MEKLLIITDLKDMSWLRYVLDEFKRINLALFEIEIRNICHNGMNDFKANSKILYYTAEPVGEVSIFNSGQKLPDGNIKYIEDLLYILSGTDTNKPFSIKYDLFWNAFVFLSRLEENMKATYSYASRHIRKDKKSFLIPIVNVLFNKLEDFLKNKFQLKFGQRSESVIDLSHDVDYVRKTWQLLLKQSIMNLYNFRLKEAFRFLVSKCSYWCFEYWEELEKRFNKRSTFYIYVKHGKKGFRDLVIDPSYDIKTDKKLQDKLKYLKSEGFDIGLHGSYKSAVSYELMKKEKEILEDVLGDEVNKIRQHWLHYDNDTTPYSHEKLFKYDSTLGWNDMVGFRSGIASLYRPYDFKNKRAFSYYEIPQVIMDSNIFDYKNDVHIAEQVLDRAKYIPKTPYFSISWHQRVCSKDYKWNILYERMLEHVI